MSKGSIIDDNTTKKVAGLIKLDIAAGEIADYTSRLNAVIEAVEVLKELDTQAVEPATQTHGLTNIWREDDEIEPGLNMKEYPNKQNFKDGYFVVSSVISDSA